MFEDRVVLRVGAIVSALVVSAVIFALQIDFRDIGPKHRVRVYLAHPGPLRAGADVQLGGRMIGKVHSIRLVTSREARAPEHLLHPDGGVLLDVWIRKKYSKWVRLNGELFVNSKGLIGESYLEVTPPPGQEEMQRPVREGDEIRGIDPARMEHIIVTSFINARRFGELLDDLRPDAELLRQESSQLLSTLIALEPEPGAFAAIGASVQRIGDGLHQLESQFDDQGPALSQMREQGGRLLDLAVQEVATIEQEAAVLASQLRAVRQRLPEEPGAPFRQVAQDAEDQIATLRATLAKLQDLVKRVQAGNGTVGALANDGEFADDAKKLGRFLKRHPWKLLSRPID